MNGLTILGVAFGLAMDAFAVSIAAGLTLEQVTARHRFRLGFHFGLFQFLMPILGWLAGKGIADQVQAFDHWVAFGVLGLVGGKMIWESWTSHDAERPPRADPTRGWSLIMLSVATSLDALAVGFGMAALGVSVGSASVVIGLVAAAMTVVGLSLGRRLGTGCGRWAELAGGLVLLGIGSRILVSHL